MTNPSKTGDTVNSTTTNSTSTTGAHEVESSSTTLQKQETKSMKRKRQDQNDENSCGSISSTKQLEVPRKKPLRHGDNGKELLNNSRVEEVTNEEAPIAQIVEPRSDDNRCARKRKLLNDEINEKADDDSQVAEDPSELYQGESRAKDEENLALPCPKVLKRDVEENFDGVENEHDECKAVLKKVQDSKKVLCTEKKDVSNRLRKTIQWLEEDSRKMREDLAAVRAQLHEERRASKVSKRQFDSALREAKNLEATKYQRIISDLKTRLSQSPSRISTDSSKTEYLKEENHRREMSALRKRLTEAESTIQKLKTNSLCVNKRRKVNEDDVVRKLENDIRNLRTSNKELEKKLYIVSEAEKARATELRIQHENHENELATLHRTLRSDTIKMMDELRRKSRVIEKLEKLIKYSNNSNRKSRFNDDIELMRKLRESERNLQIRGLSPRIEEKLSSGEPAMRIVDLCKGDCDANAEVERLRELAVEQQEVIEVLRQAVKERERKLDQLSNKKRKEEFYRQWLELEPVAEVDDEEEHDEGDSALSSAPSSLSPQPGGCGQWQANGITREAYEAVLMEVEELQTKLLEERQELSHAKSQVRDLEKALLQETRGSQNNRRALNDKLREAEEREANLLAELSELREQNELLEFRVLELEESPSGLRDTPDPADSGVVSPEPIHLYKDQMNKQKGRAVATVIPYTNYNQPISPPLPQKSPLSLQESGIFEEVEEDEEEIQEELESAEIELTNRSTQTETPSGELLQEIQRLQELRERIQERACKVSPNTVADSSKACYLTADINETEYEQMSYQEKIKELEEKLEKYEVNEKKNLEDKRMSKLREEELLDENYKLTERIYWLENELRKFEKTVTDACTMTDESDEIIECHNIYCQNLKKDYVEKIGDLIKSENYLKDQIEELERKEEELNASLCKARETWEQIEMDHSKRLENIKEELNEKSLSNQQFSNRLIILEEFLRNCSCRSSNSSSIENLTDESKIQKQILKSTENIHKIESMEIENNEVRATKAQKIEFECKATQTYNNHEDCIKCRKNDVEELIGFDFTDSVSNKSYQRENSVELEVAREATEDDQESPMKSINLEQSDKCGSNDGLVGQADSSSSAIEKEEANAEIVIETEAVVTQQPREQQRQVQELEEAVVTINENDTDKKVRHKKRIRNNEKEGWAMKHILNTTDTTSCSSISSSKSAHNRDKSSRLFKYEIEQSKRLVLYQEICV